MLHGSKQSHLGVCMQLQIQSLHCQCSAFPCLSESRAVPPYTCLLHAGLALILRQRLDVQGKQCIGSYSRFQLCTIVQECDQSSNFHGLNQSGIPTCLPN